MSPCCSPMSPGCSLTWLAGLGRLSLCRELTHAPFRAAQDAQCQPKSRPVGLQASPNSPHEWLSHCKNLLGIAGAELGGDAASWIEAFSLEKTRKPIRSSYHLTQPRPPRKTRPLAPHPHTPEILQGRCLCPDPVPVPQQLFRAQIHPGTPPKPPRCNSGPLPRILLVTT